MSQRQPEQTGADPGWRGAKLPPPRVAQLLEIHRLKLLQPRVDVRPLRHQPTILHARTPSTFSLAIAYPFFRSPLSAARTVCGSQPVARVRSSSVAPPSRKSRSMSSAALVPPRAEGAAGSARCSALFSVLLAIGRAAGRER